MPRSLADQLAGLPGLDRPALVELWQKVFKSSPPHNMSRPLMLRALAYRLQEDALGGLKAPLRRHMLKVAEQGRNVATPTATVKSGTRLLREWHGVTHEVTVQEDGVYYHGTRYRSLSQVAKLITGTKWSGPLFFGLKKAASS